MLRSSKLTPPKMHKSSKDQLMGRSHLVKKPSRSPLRMMSSSRPPPPGMKRMTSESISRMHAMEKRRSRSPHMRPMAMSPHRSLPRRKPESPPMERIPSAKSFKYEKGKFSPSPVRRSSPPQGKRDVLSMSAIGPYPREKYPSSATGSLSYLSPTRKKVKREPYGYERISASPPRRNGPPPPRVESHLSRRDAPPSHMLEKRRISPVPAPRAKHGPVGVSSIPTKNIPVKAPPRSPENRGRYVSPSLSKSYPPPGSKSSVPTLHERFSSVSETGSSEARIKYSREDLEKITIDIRRNLRETSPTIRHIINPADVKLVRRPNEGRRPIFDKDDIKHAQRDMREDAYYERKRMERDPYGIDHREFENYQITRHRFDRDRNLFGSASGRTLNDRWQTTENQKEYPSYDRDLREKEYARNSNSSIHPAKRSRSRSDDRDFRGDRYIDSKSAPNKSEYLRRPNVEIPPPRNLDPYHPSQKSGGPSDARQKISMRKGDVHPPAVRYEPKNNYGSYPERSYLESSSSRGDRRDHSPVAHQKWDKYGPLLNKDRYGPLQNKGRSISREREYLRPPEKSYSKNWSEKPSMPPRGSSIYESDRRENSSPYSRGGSRPFLGPRGNPRGRGFRGLMRGSSFRGSFRGGSSSSRGRGMIRR